MTELTEERVREIVREEINKYMKERSALPVYTPWYSQKDKATKIKKA